MRIRLSLLVAAGFLLSGHASAERTRIPLKQGTVYTHAVAFPAGDEEHITTLTALDDQSATFTVEFRSLKDPTLNQTFIRRVRRKDLVEAHRSNQVFQPGDPESFPGSTFMHLSTAALDELKRTGETAMVFGDLKDYQGMAGSASMFTMIMSGRKYFRGVLKRVGNGTVKIPVLVNGKRELLPAIETTGTFSVGGDAVQKHRWWLDDPDNAISLRAAQGKIIGQLVRIDFPVAIPMTALLQDALAGGDGSLGGAGSLGGVGSLGAAGGANGAGGAGRTCRASLSGIYFDFAQATLLPQSAGTLKAVAYVMTANSGWSLRIEGHTDNVGGGPFNLTLSQRRAAAVRDALIARFKVPAARLAATGFGLSRPVASNDSLVGRAANRRVELSRTCP